MSYSGSLKKINYNFRFEELKLLFLKIIKKKKRIYKRSHIHKLSLTLGCRRITASFHLVFGIGNSARILLKHKHIDKALNRYYDCNLPSPTQSLLGYLRMFYETLKKWKMFIMLFDAYFVQFLLGSEQSRYIWPSVKSLHSFLNWVTRSVKPSQKLVELSGTFTTVWKEIYAAV